MKNVSTLIMITIFAVAGYYVGTAVAQSQKAPDMVDDAVVMVEEDYDVVVPDEKTPKTLNDMKEDVKDKIQDKKTDMMKSVDEHKAVKDTQKAVQNVQDGATLVEEAVW